jgi:hypothetical protein
VRRRDEDDADPGRVSCALTLRAPSPPTRNPGHSNLYDTVRHDVIEEFCAPKLVTYYRIFFCRCLQLCVVDLGPIQRDDACQRFNVGHLIQNHADNMAYGGPHAFLMSDHWGIRA